MLHDALLFVHVIAGTTGLLLGPLALAVPKRAGWHPWLGRAYLVVVAEMTSTAMALAVLDPTRLWFVGLIAVATAVTALTGWRARVRRAPSWVGRHVSLMCGSYVSFVTAALVVNWSSPLTWILPTLIGSPLIAAASRRASRTGTVPGPASAAVAGTSWSGARCDSGVPAASTRVRFRPGDDDELLDLFSQAAHGSLDVETLRAVKEMGRRPRPATTSTSTSPAPASGRGGG